MNQNRRPKKTTFYGDPRLKRIRDIKELRATLEKAVAIAASLVSYNQDFEHVRDEIETAMITLDLIPFVNEAQNAK